MPNGLIVKDNYKNKGCEECEQIQDSFLKYCINVSNHSSNVMRRAELGKFPQQFKVQAQMVKYFLRIAQGTGNRLLDEAYASSQETGSKIRSLLEWCFIISIEVSIDYSQLSCTGFAGSH